MKTDLPCEEYGKPYSPNPGKPGGSETSRWTFTFELWRQGKPVKCVIRGWRQRDAVAAGRELKQHYRKHGGYEVKILDAVFILGSTV